MAAEKQVHPSSAMQPTPPASAESTVHHTPARRKRGRTPPRIGLNLTPLIDVVFQLMVYFVVTAGFWTDEGVLTTRMPQGGGRPPSALELPAQPLNLILEPQGPAGVRIAIGDFDEAATFDELARKLASLQQDPVIYKSDDPVYIRPQGQVRWQHVVNALNAAIRAGFTQVRFVQPSPQPPGQ
ncbi:MAG TPA: biopolymer transporter ExbD [Phycisphaeraceae bacterium]